jgi:DMSO/TMAO reductase YedYZ molybdopterin-dependent catalytic subunit
MKPALALVFFASLNAQSLTIGGDVAKPLALTRDDLRKLPRASVTLSDHGKDTSYEGVLLYDILKQAGAPLDSQLTGQALASYLLAEARDGYQVVYTLAEVDPAFTSNKIIIADTLDGKPLSETQGPFRLVVPQEKKPARSIRMLEKITVVRLRK